ncbi:hypothetical protein S40293_00605 [Stachybotrys chartarum IBT 40293]|nr:hypothetical protein S40293_00605 [Stachybotrys chartarum IBT 40293]
MAQHQYPGINLSLRYSNSRWRLRRSEGPPGYDFWAMEDDRLLPIRELFMMALMDKLTDKPDWHKKVFDEAIVAKWRAEAHAQSERELFDRIVHKARHPTDYAPREEDEEQDGHDEIDRVVRTDRYTQRYGHTMTTHVPFPRSRILSEEAFEFCIRELRVKAAYVQRTGLVPTLDALERAVVKSDSLVGQGLKTRLRDIFSQLRADQQSKGLDWHPRTNETVLDLVHPSLYPFVYGTSIPYDLLSAAADLSGRSPFIQEEVVGVEDAVDSWAGKGQTAPAVPVLGHREAAVRPVHDWSEKYQWLPANVGFRDGRARFSSYINNLHPKKYAHVYRAVEELVDLAIPAWDQALGHYGRKTSRFSPPKEAHDTETPGLWEELNREVLANYSITPTQSDLRELKYRTDFEGIAEEDLTSHTAGMDNWLWEKVRDAILPEPDDSPEVDYSCEQSIRDIFKDTGLQIYVKFARIELTPEKPDFPAGGWHVEGMMNERICATALYYLDSENITTSALDFRTKTEPDQDDIQYSAGQDAFNWLERVYGVNFREDFNLQYYGRVETREGRLLAFPNSFQHRVTPFSLQDRTKPGHRSFIALWLVDPAIRVVSTANVPPQQLDWWAEAVFGRENTSTGEMPLELVQLLLEKPEVAGKLPGSARQRAVSARLPPELYDMLRAEPIVVSGLMSLEEAREHRLRLMDERTVHAADVDQAVNVETYSFCEH